MSGIRSHNSNEAGSPVNSLSVSLNNVLALDTLVLVISTSAVGDRSVISVVDDSENVWLQVPGATIQQSGFDLDIWYAKNVAAASSVNITATIFGGATQAFGLAAYDLDLAGGGVIAAATAHTAAVTDPYTGPSLTDTGLGDGIWIAAISTRSGFNVSIESPWTRDEELFPEAGSTMSTSTHSGGTETPVFTGFTFTGGPAVVSVVVFDPPAQAPASTVFLGSVVEDDSAPDGPFLGTVTVVSSAPAGASNPYLGRIKSGSPGPNNTNPSLGQVVIISEVPAGQPDIFLGNVQKS